MVSLLSILKLCSFAFTTLIVNLSELTTIPPEIIRKPLVREKKLIDLLNTKRKIWRRSLIQLKTNKSNNRQAYYVIGEFRTQSNV